MRKYLVIAALCAAVAVLFAVPVVQAFEIPCEVEIVPEGEPAGDRFATVTFSHEPHVDLTCTACHHMFEGCGEIMSCRECHFDRDDRQDTMGFYFAWHGKDALNSCLGCHKALAAEGNEVVPTKCSQGCHVSE
ncbi:MAG: hypothetical protein D6E12_04295 [Desulfovibrio sp.]|nr:MAG: hypothetical protein D6E12_04295 [Desulfovibrio sp.]